MNNPGQALNNDPEPDEDDDVHCLTGSPNLAGVRWRS
jgi:hypothetical protein